MVIDDTGSVEGIDELLSITQLWTQPLGVKFGDDIDVNFSVLKVSTRQQLSNQIFPSGD